MISSVSGLLGDVAYAHQARSRCLHPDPFRSVRDLGRVPGRCSWPSGIPIGRSPRWLPAWLPVAEDLADWFGCCGPSAYAGRCLDDPDAVCPGSVCAASLRYSALMDG